MCLSIFFAFVVGAYLFLTSLAMLVHQHHYKKVCTDCLADPAMVSLTGCLQLMIGLVIVATHNFWVADWPLLITLVGWISLLMGLAKLLAPTHYCRWCRENQAKSGCYLLTWIFLLVGLYLVWVAYASNQAEMMVK